MCQDSELAAMAAKEKSVPMRIVSGVGAGGDLLMRSHSAGSLYFPVSDVVIATILPLALGYLVSDVGLTALGLLLATLTAIHFLEIHLRDHSAQDNVHVFSSGELWQLFQEASVVALRFSRTPGVRTYFAQGVCEPVFLIAVALVCQIVGYTLLALYLALLAFGLFCRNASRFSTRRRQRILAQNAGKEMEIVSVLRGSGKNKNPDFAQDFNIYPGDNHDSTK